jgi:plastocyanin
VALGLALAGCGGDEGDDEAAAPSGPPIETVTISATDFKFDPASVELDKPAVYTFRLVNDGDAPHALEIEGAGIEEETEEVAPGSSAELTVELEEGGEYELYCPIGNHRELGMEGTLTLGGGATTTDEDESSGYGS